MQPGRRLHATRRTTGVGYVAKADIITSQKKKSFSYLKKVKTIESRERKHRGSVLGFRPTHTESKHAVYNKPNNTDHAI